MAKITSGEVFGTKNTKKKQNKKQLQLKKLLMDTLKFHLTYMKMFLCSLGVIFQIYGY